MDIKLSKRVGILTPSITISINSLAKEMRASGEDVISLSAGEPDFDTPKIVKDALKSALDNGCSKYTASAGTNEVLKAIQTKLKADNNLNYETSEIITSVGAKHALFNVIMTLIDSGDEAIIPAPYWVSYPQMVEFSGGKAIFIQGHEENDFKISAKDLKSAITPKTKIFILGSPSNPAGSVYNKDEILEFAKILKDTNIVVLSDEIYEKLTFNGEFCSAASVSEDMLKRTITINGLSKCAAMTGWRFGYFASKIPNLNAKIKALQSQSVSNVSSVIQAAAIPALLGKTQNEVEKMCAAYLQRRDYAVNAINSIDGLSVKIPNGAFYLFVNCSKIERDSMKFCENLLKEQKVAVVPGIGFGMDGYFRISFATDLENIKKAISRIEKFVKSYKI